MDTMNLWPEVRSSGHVKRKKQQWMWVWKPQRELALCCGHTERHCTLLEEPLAPEGSDAKLQLPEREEKVNVSLPFAKPLINTIFLHESKSQTILNSSLQEIQEGFPSLVQWLFPLSRLMDGITARHFLVLPYFLYSCQVFPASNLSW